MCILCLLQKWSRQVATMLPWLVIPLVAFWVISQFFFPPAFRFEVTSARLACVVVLLATLFWYEILVPQLSVWRARRNARMRDLSLSEVIYLQNRRRCSTRCCRNCGNPYRDQNPGGGGRFMCSYCGHVSKRPKLDLLESTRRDPRASGSGRNDWICSQEWPLYGGRNWVSQFSVENVVLSASSLPSCVFSYLRWAWKKVLSIGSLGEDGSLDKDSRGFSSKKGENGDNSAESKGEKARRKAEEKRQARLEKEMLEAEERKQREEVARLVEERRKLRDEMLEAEKESIKRSQSVSKRDCRKGTEKWRQEGGKEKDKCSSKSNSDGEELDKRTSREREGKLACDTKSENERRVAQKPSTEGHRSPASHGSPASHAGDRTKGLFQSSFRGSVTKASKPANGSLDQRQSSANRKDAQFSGHKITSNGDSRKIGINIHRPVEIDVQPRPPVQKKSWLQLFTRSSSAVSPYPDARTPNFPNNNSQLETESACRTDQRMLSNYSLDNHIGLGESLPFPAYPSLNQSFTCNSVSQLATEYMSPCIKGSRQDTVSDDTDVFEEPCFVPDPVTLLGPVSESLDNFSLDLGTGFNAAHNMEKPRRIKNAHVLSDMSRPSPIESPLSKQRVSEERLSVTPQLSKGLHGSDRDKSRNTHEEGTWQMWGTPLAQDGLGLIGGANWFSQLGKCQNKSNQVDTMQPLLQDPIVSHIAKDNHEIPGTHTPSSVQICKYQNGGISGPLGSVPDDNDQWPQRTLFNSFLVDGDNRSLPLDQMDNLAPSEVAYDTPSRASSDISELSSANCWSKRDCTLNGPQDAQNSPFTRPHNGGPFLTNPDVQLVWPLN